MSNQNNSFKNLFLHFLNYDTLVIYGINPKNIILGYNDICKALKSAILLCNQYCLIPCGFFFESQLTRKVISDNFEFLERGLVKFAIRELDIYGFVEKKNTGILNTESTQIIEIFSIIQFSVNLMN